MVQVIALAVFLPKLDRLLVDYTSRFHAFAPDFSGTITDGMLTLRGVNQPLVWDEDNFQVVVDTRISPSSSPLEKVGQPGVGIFYDKMVVRNESATKTLLWSEFPNLTVTHDLINVALVRWHTWRWLILSFSIFGWWVVFVVSHLFSILAASFFAVAAGRLRNQDWKWQEAFTIGLFAITLPCLLEIFFGRSGSASAWGSLLVIALVVGTLHLQKNIQSPKL